VISQAECLLERDSDHPSAPVWLARGGGSGNEHSHASLGLLGLGESIFPTGRHHSGSAHCGLLLRAAHWHHLAGDPPVTDHVYYPITLTDKGYGSPTRISFQGVLFRVGQHTFLNLIPSNDSGMRRIPGSPPTLSEILHDVVFARRGVVFRIEIVDRGVRVWIPDREAIDPIPSS
jgi:hypothetical protein